MEKLLRGRVARAVKVVTVDNSLRKTRLKSLIQKLYPLEINVRDEKATNAKAVQHYSERTFKWSEMKAS